MIGSETLSWELGEKISSKNQMEWSGVRSSTARPMLIVSFVYYGVRCATSILRRTPSRRSRMELITDVSYVIGGTADTHVARNCVDLPRAGARRRA